MNRALAACANRLQSCNGDSCSIATLTNHQHGVYVGFVRMTSHGGGNKESHPRNVREPLPLAEAFLLGIEVGNLSSFPASDAIPPRWMRSYTSGLMNLIIG